MLVLLGQTRGAVLVLLGQTRGAVLVLLGQTRGAVLVLLGQTRGAVLVLLGQTRGAVLVLLGQTRGAMGWCCFFQMQGKVCITPSFTSRYVFPQPMFSYSRDQSRPWEGNLVSYWQGFSIAKLLVSVARK